MSVFNYETRDILDIIVDSSRQIGLLESMHNDSHVKDYLENKVIELRRVLEEEVEDGLQTKD